MRNTIIKASEYSDKIESLSADNKVLFYEFMAHEITIGMRFIWSDKEISIKDQNEQMKWLNEVQHHVVNKLRQARRNTNEVSEAEFIHMIHGYIEKCPGIGKIINVAIESSYDSLQRTKS